MGCGVVIDSPIGGAEGSEMRDDEDVDTDDAVRGAGFAIDECNVPLEWRVL